MYSVSKTFQFCYGHRLLREGGKCKSLHGHTAKATFFLKSQDLDERGMVVHFDKLKETLGKWIAENLDHALLISRDDPVVKSLDESREKYLALPSNPTAENIAKLLFDKALEFKLPVYMVEIWESDTSRASYEK